MFVHWSNTETTYRDMDRIQGLCNRCKSEQIHTFRLYEQKTKHYSAFSIGADHRVTAICHNCLLESSIPKNEEQLLIRTFLRRLACAEGFEFMKEGKIDKARKKFEKILKEDPEQAQALYGMAKSLIAQNKFEEAIRYVNDLNAHYSESAEVKELKEILARNAQ